MPRLAHLSNIAGVPALVGPRVSILAGLAAVLAVGLSGCSSSSPGGPTVGRLRLQTCTVQGVTARCGTFRVPEDRANPGGRTIALRVVVLPAFARPVARDAVTYLAGGPGAAATSETAVLSRQLAPLNEHHDIVLVDQRGTGADAYSCPSRSAPFRSRAELRTYTLSCVKAFGRDMNRYGTRTAMDDLDAVRAALGYRRFDVIGGSYGATAAQVYANLHPASVRTLVLVGATALDVPFFGHYAVNAQRALDQLARLCTSQFVCRTTFPGWERRFGELVRAWNAHPVRVRPGVTMTGDRLAGVVHAMLLDLQKAVSIPLAVTRAAHGDYGPLNRAGQGDFGTASPQLMAWSIWCNEPWAGLGATGPWGTMFDSYTSTKVAAFRQGCSFVPKRAEPRAPWTLPSAGRVPVLAFQGGADPQDPAANLSGLARHFPDSRTVILPHIGHQFGIGGCAAQITRDFVARGTTRGLDTTRCAGAVVVPPFTVR